MTEQELREKIVKTIKENGVYNGKSMHRDYYVVNDEEFADALLAAGIGDINEWKRKAEVTERILKNTEKLADETVKVMKKRVKKIEVENAELRERLRKAMSCPRRFGIVFKGDDDV